MSIYKTGPHLFFILNKANIPSTLASMQQELTASFICISTIQYIYIITSYAYSGGAASPIFLTNTCNQQLTTAQVPLPKLSLNFQCTDSGLSATSTFQQLIPILKRMKIRYMKNGLQLIHDCKTSHFTPQIINSKTSNLSQIHIYDFHNPTTQLQIHLPFSFLLFLFALY